MSVTENFFLGFYADDLLDQFRIDEMVQLVSDMWQALYRSYYLQDEAKKVETLFRLCFSLVECVNDCILFFWQCLLPVMNFTQPSELCQWLDGFDRFLCVEVI